jgi:16S rRNA (guanine966-N2)-methyltransferase
MRIIGGRFKRRRLADPPDMGVRPTSDRLRETLFNVLGATVEEARVVDGFAGTGALGLEALSRGARHVVFVESDVRATRVLWENIRRCGAEEACTVVEGEFLKSCRAVEAGMPQSGVDLALLDPPYEYGHVWEALGGAASLVRPGGRVVLEHSRRRESPDGVGLLRRVRVLVAGESALSFYCRDAEGVGRSAP